MSDLAPGDIVTMKGFTASYENCDLKFAKLSGERKYAFMLLGAGSPESPLDANQCLNALGWSFDPDAAAKQLTERQAKVAP